VKKLLKLFGKGKVLHNKFDLDGDGKVESLREEIAGVFNQFSRMRDKLDHVNNQLDEVIEEEKFAKEVEQDQLERIIEEANRKIEQSNKVIEKAELEKKANEKLKEKVSDFIV
jgi:DNA anti-recombination protein RmuC